MPDTNSDHQEDEIVSYEYTTVNFDQAKFKIDPFKPDQNSLKFTLKKASTFRFELIAYPCMSTPIERSVVLKSVSKTHNKITSETVANGIPIFGNGVLLYVNELLPGNYELELQFGWLNDYQPKKTDKVSELMDFQIEIYSLYQDPESAKLLHYKDRAIHQLETIVRDLSVISFIGNPKGQYLGQEVYIPTHPEDKDSPIGVPFKIVEEHAQVLLYVNLNFTYLESIQILMQGSNSLIKRIHGGTEKSISEVLPSGDYILQFNYLDEKERPHDPLPQVITFGISSYENIKTYKR